MAKKRQAITPVDLITAINPFSTAAEQYRKIRTNIEFSSADKKIKSLVVTSSGPSEGKTTTAANLAVVFANAGSRVVLVDADLRKPNVALSLLHDPHDLRGVHRGTTTQRDNHVWFEGVCQFCTFKTNI